MSEKNDGDKKRIFVSGKTFDIKDTLRAIGFQWDRPRKRWWREVTAEELEQARSAVASLGVTVHVEGEGGDEPAADAPAPAKRGGGRGRGGSAPTGPRITVGGKTYPLRQEIKDLGFKWDGGGKQWWREATKEEAEALRPKLESLSPELEISWVEDA